MTIVQEEKVKPILAWLRSLDVFRIRQRLDPELGRQGSQY